jgi:hypothetical protein
VTSQVWTYDRLWAADLDGDGRAEALTHASGGAPPSVHAWTGTGDGALVALASSQVGSFDVGALGSVDADGFADFVAGLGQAPLVNPWLGDGDGGFSSGALLWPFSFSTLALGDLDGDGFDELLTDVPGNDWRVTIYANYGGGFSDQTVDLAAVSYAQLRSADVDGDGRDDVILTPLGAPPRVMVLRSN